MLILFCGSVAERQSWFFSSLIEHFRVSLIQGIIDPLILPFVCDPRIEPITPRGLFQEISGLFNQLPVQLLSSTYMAALNL